MRVAGLPFRSRNDNPVNVQSFRFITDAPIAARVVAGTNYIDLFTAAGSTSGASELPTLTTSNLTTGNAFANGLRISGQVLIN